MAGRDVPLSVRRLVLEVDVDGLNVTQFCDDHQISTWFFYDLRRRAARGESIEVRSRAPQRVANRISSDVEDAIVVARKTLLDMGHDAGPASIWSRLHDEGLVAVPSEATIWRALKARGLIIPAPAKAPKRKGCRFVAARANEWWQLDDTTWWLADDTEVKIFNALDDHSRLLVASTAQLTMTGMGAFHALAEAAVVLGWAAGFQSDNAPEFRYVLAELLAGFGVAARHSRPAHPQTNGKVERFHQTLKRWLARQHPAAAIEELQAQLDLFRLHYNHHRRHRGIDRQRPADVWANAPKSGPADQPLGQPTRIYHGIVNNGNLRLAKRWRVALGAAHNDQPGVAVVTGTRCHVFVNGRLARQLTFNHQRVDQPLKPTRQLP
jgi:transposase InsO family protein